MYEEVWSNSVPVGKDQIVQAIQTSDGSNETLRNSLKEYLKKSRAKLANETMNDFARARSILIATEIAFLIDTWDKISKAENLIRDTKLFEAIEHNIKAIGADMPALEQKFQAWNADSSSQLLRMEFLAFSNKLMMNYNKAVSDLSKIQVKGTMNELNFIRKSSMKSGVLSAIQTGSSIYTLVRLFSNLSQPSRVYGSLIALGHAFITTWHFSNVYLTGKQIEELRQKFEHFELLEEQLERIRVQLDSFC